jgi:hypothetical protein
VYTDIIACLLCAGRCSHFRDLDSFWTQACEVEHVWMDSSDMDSHSTFISRPSSAIFYIEQVLRCRLNVSSPRGQNAFLNLSCYPDIMYHVFNMRSQVHTEPALLQWLVSG